MEEDRDDEGRKCQLETVEKDSPQSWEVLAGRSLWGQCNRALIVTSADDNADLMIRWRLRLWGLWLLVFYQGRTFETKGRMRPPGLQCRWSEEIWRYQVTFCRMLISWGKQGRKGSFLPSQHRIWQIRLHCLSGSVFVPHWD